MSWVHFAPYMKTLLLCTGPWKMTPSIRTLASYWKLNPAVFDLLCHKWGPLNINLFASWLSVYELLSRPTGSSYRCVHPRLGDLSRVCLPSICLNRLMPPKNSESTSVTHGVSSTSLASPILVPSPIRPMHRLPCPHTNSGRPPDTGSETPPTQTLGGFCQQRIPNGRHFWKE